MGTTIFHTAANRTEVIAREFAPLEVVAASYGATSAVAAVRIPITDDNIEDLGRVYDLSEAEGTIVSAIIIKHEGTLNGTGPRNVSWKDMPEDMNPYYSGGATKSLMDKLTPLLPCPKDENTGALPLHWAHDWRKAAEAAQ